MMSAETASKAACAGDDRFIKIPSRNTRAAYEVLIQVCNTCVIKEECLAEALEFEEQDPIHARKYAYGIFGGATPLMRSRMRKKNV